MDQEEKYTDIAEKLQNLEKIEASRNFTHNLQAKIIEFESEKRKEHTKRNEDTKGGFLRDLFGNLQYPWLIPAAGFTILIFFIFYVTYQDRNIPDSVKNVPSIQNDKNIDSENSVSKPEGIVEKEEEVNSESEKSGTGSDKTTGTKDKNIAGLDPDLTDNKTPDKMGLKNSGKNPVTSDLILSENSTLNGREKKATENNPANTEDEVKSEMSSEPEKKDFQGMISEEKSRTMATVTPEAKISDSSESKGSNKNKEVSTMLLKISRIDRNALERIREEISK